MKKPVHNPREVAEIVAVQALSFIAGDPERLGLFLAESGIGPETLRTARPWQSAGPTLRIHAGLEDVDDLIADLARGFDRLNAAR